ncbi:MAG: peptide chain release factor N(5)-glutamine methyltransferase [Sideroxydans sp.]|nr:peptide chain release factor N(5)-glutamine methyltransferase [Sideroxydans sp.]
MPTIADIQQGGARQLIAALELDKETARIEIQCLLQHVLGVPKAYLLAHPEQVLSADQAVVHAALLQRRLCGEPIAHLLGEREFFGLNFKVTPATLIPRPDTELIVELALQRLPPNSVHQVLDMGTGSGIIALCIAHSRRNVSMVAVDASPEALAVAMQNASRLDVRNVTFLQSDWFSAFDTERFDLIVSNPPYIEDADEHLNQGDLRFEPITALASGVDGLDDIRRIVKQAPRYLNENGWLMLEHGYNQAEAVCELLDQSGFTSIFSEKDLSGIDRVSGGKLINQ